MKYRVLWRGTWNDDDDDDVGWKESVTMCSGEVCGRSFVRSKDAPRPYVLKGITSDAFFFQQTAVVSAFHQRVIRHSFCSYLERIFPS